MKCPQCTHDSVGVDYCQRCGWQEQFPSINAQPRTPILPDEAQHEVNREAAQQANLSPAERTVADRRADVAPPPISPDVARSADGPPAEVASAASSRDASPSRGRDASGTALPELTSVDASHADSGRLAPHAHPSERAPTGQTRDATSDSEVRSRSASEPSRRRSQKRAIDLRDGEVGELLAASRDIYKILHPAFHFHSANDSKRGVELKLTELTSELKLEESDDRWFDREEIDRRRRALQEERVLLVSCVDSRLARDAVRGVLGGFRLARERIRLLNFDRLTADAPDLTVYDIVSVKRGFAADSAILVDCVTPRGHAFLGSLLGTPGAQALWSAMSIKQALLKKHAMLICFAEAGRIEEACAGLREPPFSHWSVPFISCQLLFAFPDRSNELEKRILEQRTHGRWSRDDAQMNEQLRDSIARGVLLEDIEKGGYRTGEAAATLPEGHDDPVRAAALYVAAFFDPLTTQDFNRAMSAVLGSRTITIVTPQPPANRDDPPPPPLQKEKALRQIWLDTADPVLRACKVVTARDRTPRVFVFSEPGLQGMVRELLEAEYPFAVHSNFQSLHDAGLLFEGSDALAESLARLTVSTAASAPEAFGAPWLMELFQRSLAESSWQPRRLKRFSDLLRGYCSHSALKQSVDALLEQLLRGGAHRDAFELTKRLQFADGFDAYGWLKQIADRGGHDAQAQVYLFLYGDLERSSANIYPVLHALSRWLPSDNRPPESYPPSASLALRSFVAFAVDTIQTTEPQEHGVWPPRYPLFTVADGAEMDAAMALIADVLLNPGMSGALEESELSVDIEPLIAALLAEWTSILIGLPERASPTLGGMEHSSPGGRGLRMLDVLLGHVMAKTESMATRPMRDALYAHWTSLQSLLEDMLASIDPADRDAMHLILNKRATVRALVQRCRSLERAVPSFAS